MAELTMGVDIGTTRLKAGVVDEERALIHAEATATPWRITDEGPVVDVAELGDVVIGIVRQCAREVAALGHRVVGIGTTGMGETGALLDAGGEPLAPGFAWHHTLGDADAVQRALGRDRFAAVTGHGCDLAPSVIKLDYLRGMGHRFAPGQRWLNIPEYISYRLTGEQACEFSLSGRTGLYDLRGQCWWDDALNLIGAGTWLLPGDPLPAGAVVGKVPSSIPEVAGAVVTTAGHDHPVAAASVMSPVPGTLCYSLGTSEAQLRVVTADLAEEQIRALVAIGATVDRHPNGEAWYVLGTLPTGLTLERLAALLGRSDTRERLALSREAMTVERAPGARLREVSLDGFDIVGVTSGDTPAGLWLTAVESLLAVSDGLRDEMSAVIGAPRAETVLGGWTHDPLVMRERGRRGQRTTDNSPLEPGIVGAAMAAAKASGQVTALWQ